MTDHAPAQPAQDHHALPPASDISHFFHDAQGQPISLLANPVAYINAIKAAGMASHLAPTPNAPGETPGAGGNSGPPTAKPPGATLDATQIKHQINDTTSIGIAAQLAMYSRAMNDNTSKAFIQTLDRIDDPDLRHKVMAQFQAQTGQTLEGFIKGCNDWNNNGENRDKTAALQLISTQRDDAENNLAKLTPAERAKKEDEADKIARDIVSATSAHDHSDANQQKIFRDLGGRTPEEIELIRAKVAVHTHGESNLYQKIDDGTHKGDEDEAVAMLAGNRVDSARAALANEDDPKRLREVVTGLKADELEKLRGSPDTAKLLDRIKNPSDRAEIESLLNNNKAGADAEHLGNLLKPKQEGMKTDEYGALDKVGLDNYDRRKPANVLKEFEAMSGPDVQAAAEAWNKSHPGEPSFEKMLETRWGDDSDKTEYNRILAMIHGDKGMNRSLRVQEGMRENDQDEIEAALAHDKVDAKALGSEDAEVRKKAEATKAENDSFEANNIEADRRARQIYLDFTGQEDQVAVGRSTRDQLTAHYDEQGRKDIGTTWNEEALGGDAAKLIHADRQKKADEKNRDNRVGAMEMLDDGKLSTETEVHRGKGAKEKAETLEGITSNKELAEAQQRYREKYGKEMLPYTGDDRKDMNANELMIENIRLYGVKAERPAKVEYLLQLQQYEKQYSKSLETDEAYDAGGGTQRWQRQELASMRDMLKDPQLEAHDPTTVTDQLGMIHVVDDENEPTFEKIDKLLPMKGEKVEDGLKDGVTKHDFSNIDKGMTEANKAEEGAKKRLADRIVKIFSTIAKIAAALTAQPELIALIDIGEGLIEMGVKWQVMGEAYDPAEDAKMLAFTAAADVALMGFAKAGKLKGAAAAAEHEVLVGEKTAMEIEGAVSGEAKAEAFKEGAHAAAGESKALEGAIEEGASAEKALGSEAASSVGSRVEKQAAEAAEGKALHEGESAAAKSAEGEAAKAAEDGVEGVAKEEMSPQALAQQIEKRYGLYGAGAKMAITTVGGGIVQGKSPTEVLKGLVTGGLGLILPGHLSEKVREAMGNDGLAQKILGEIASFGTEFTANTAINVAGGGDAGDVMTDQLIGLGGARIQRVRGARAAAREEEQNRQTSSVEPPAETAPANTTRVATEGAQEPAFAPELMPTAPVNPALAGAVTTPHVSMEKGESAHRLAKNAPEVSAKAEQALNRMEPSVREQHETMLASAETPAHRVLLERALASGHSLDDVRRLQTAMAGMPEAEALRHFSGAGLVQFYMHSCVPTAYQIAIAEVDPVYALHLRSNPQEILDAQRAALEQTGGARVPRNDLHKPPSALAEHLNNPQIEAALRNPSSDVYESNGTRGIETTKMQGQELHNQLEAVTGSPYQVITNEAATHQTPGAGEFERSNLPHDRIGRALDAGQPVLFGTHAAALGGTHERVFIGREIDDAGKITYVVVDPINGSTTKQPASDFDLFEMISITLPEEAQGPSPAEGAQEAANTTTGVSDPRTLAGAADPEPVYAPPDNLTVDKKNAPVRETRGWSAEYAESDAPHLPLIAAGHAALPPGLDAIVHPDYTPNQKAMLAQIDAMQAQVKQDLKSPPAFVNPALATSLAEQSVRLVESRANLVASFDEQRQQLVKAKTPEALAMMEQLQKNLFRHDETEANAMAARAPIDDSAIAAIKNASRTEDGVRGDMAGFARLTGELPDARLEKRVADPTNPEDTANTASYLYGGKGNQSTLNVGKNPKSATIFHEFGHGLEHDHPEFHEAAKSFLDARATLAADGGTPTLRPMKEIADRDAKGEGFEGGFADKYTGRTYPEQTEILSTGLGSMSDKNLMLELFTQDPEHFEFILGILEKLKPGNRNE